MKSGKVWGETNDLVRTSFVNVKAIDVLPHSFCSMHCHPHHWNAFILIGGEIEIQVRKKDYELVDVTKLSKPGEIMAVAPGEFHRFETKEHGASVSELYYPEELTEEIVRLDVGGRVVTAEEEMDWSGMTAAPINPRAEPMPLKMRCDKVPSGLMTEGSD